MFSRFRSKFIQTYLAEAHRTAPMMVDLKTNIEVRRRLGLPERFKGTEPFPAPPSDEDRYHALIEYHHWLQTECIRFRFRSLDFQLSQQTLRVQYWILMDCLLLLENVFRAKADCGIILTPEHLAELEDIEIERQDRS